MAFAGFLKSTVQNLVGASLCRSLIPEVQWLSGSINIHMCHVMLIVTTLLLIYGTTCVCTEGPLAYLDRLIGLNIPGAQGWLGWVPRSQGPPGPDMPYQLGERAMIREGYQLRG